MKYLYDSHLGEPYETDEELDDTYCETCGDSDWLIGTFETDEERDALLKEWNGI